MATFKRRSCVVAVLVIATGCLNISNSDEEQSADEETTDEPMGETNETETSEPDFIELEAIPEQNPPEKSVIYQPDDDVVRNVTIVDEFLEFVDEREEIEEGRRLGAGGGTLYDSEEGRELRKMFDEMAEDIDNRQYYLEYGDWHFLLIKSTVSDE